MGGQSPEYILGQPGPKFRLNVRSENVPDRLGEICSDNAKPLSRQTDAGHARPAKASTKMNSRSSNADEVAALATRRVVLHVSGAARGPHVEPQVIVCGARLEGPRRRTLEAGATCKGPSAPTLHSIRQQQKGASTMTPEPFLRGHLHERLHRAQETCCGPPWSRSPGPFEGPVLRPRGVGWPQG